jgi:DNA-binding NarL/FixJ family response regulator
MLALRRIDAGETFVSPSIAAGLRTLPGGGDGAVPLTSRECEVVRLIAAGHNSKTITRALYISPLTVDTHRRQLMRKLDLHSATQVVRYALRSGLLD